ncbi:hypothetical protein FA13DRAFT_1730711 [Coprinellus micaceus]|uniref:Uncharacterized protein n=1 Tax=Coprinellus micaceus TaxID=71717 RepID=A0A4Y7SE37_COPMI|nr:hypothetical protein FA13DRAFT_1744115 [Coprinellus micaceus]TEB33658.1 hypothetical protein FA13DRAFT_1730711 [Coprinellus micaceus]
MAHRTGAARLDLPSTSEFVLLTSPVGYASIAFAVPRSELSRPIYTSCRIESLLRDMSALYGDGGMNGSASDLLGMVGNGRLDQVPSLTLGPWLTTR